MALPHLFIALAVIGRIGHRALSLEILYGIFFKSFCDMDHCCGFCAINNAVVKRRSASAGEAQEWVGYA